MPGDLGVAFLSARSLLIDRHDPAASMALLNGLAIPADNPRLVLQVGVLRSDAYLAMGHPDSARAVLQGIAQTFPDNPQVQRVTAEAIGKIP